MKLSSIGVQLAWFAGICGNTVVATEAGEPQLEELIVWGTSVQASSVYLSKDAIAIKQADHVSDLLRTIPGVDVGGAHSLNQRITIRSMDDKDLRITIDGANQNTYMYHHMGNLQIHADILNSVNIEVGTNSVINGGLGGAVRFETRTARQLLRPHQQFGARAKATWNSNAGTSYALTGYGQITDAVDVLAYYNAVQRDNYEVGGDEILDENGRAIPGTDGEVRGLEGDLDDALLKLGWDIGINQRLELGYETYQDEGDYSYRPDMGLATDLAITQNLQVPLLWPTEFSRDTLTFNYDLAWGGHSSLKAALFRNESTLERDERGWQQNPAFAGSAGIITGEAENTGFNLLGESRLPRQTLTWGAEIIRFETEYRADYITDSTDRSGEKAINSAVFLQDRIDFSPLVLIPGVRYDRYDLDAAVVDDTYGEATGALAAELELGSSLLAKLSATQLFKGPEIGEVFTGAGLFDVSNPTIDAESGLNSEFALAYEDAVLGADRLSAGFTLFRTAVDDYIYDYAPAPAHTGARSWKDNVGDMTIEGIEAYIGYDLGGLHTLLTWSDAESDLDAFAAYSSLDGARLDRQQGDTFSFALDYTFERLDLALHWDVLHVESVPAGPDLDGATLDNAKDRYTVHNISGRWSPTAVPGLTVTLGVDNLLDEFYASQSSRTGLSFHPRFGRLYLQDYEPGRNIKATLTYRF